MDIVERADAYLAVNAAESGADVLITDLANEVRRLRYDLETVRLSMVADVRLIEKILGDAPCDTKKAASIRTARATPVFESGEPPMSHHISRVIAKAEHELRELRNSFTGREIDDDTLAEIERLEDLICEGEARAEDARDEDRLSMTRM